MGIGGGEYLLSGVVVLAAMIVLWLLPRLEHRIDNMREERKYEVVCRADADLLEALEQAFRDANLRVQAHSQFKAGDQVTCSWSASGSPHNHQKLVRRLPLSSLMVETDSPVLGPVPKERNEPANATLAIQAIAELKEIAKEEVVETVAENTRRLYCESFS